MLYQNNTFICIDTIVLAEESEDVSKVFQQSFPDLRRLSIFLHRALRNDESYASMLEHLHDIYEQRITITISNTQNLRMN
jgi:hypothetical protein